mgnify:CR=1 FL=1
MIGNTRFVEWFKSTDDENRNDFYNWLISKDCDRRRANIMSLVDNLPIISLVTCSSVKERLYLT